jgi:mannose-6-phosphate isomerase
VLAPRVLADGITWFDTPAPEFRLYVIDLPDPAVPGSAPALALPGIGPRIVFCLDGACTLSAAPGPVLDLTRGESCFIPFCDGPVAASAAAPARLILATPGPAPA